MTQQLAAALVALSLARGLGAQTLGPAARPATAAARPIGVADLLQLHDVGDPQLAPDGAWVAYTVSSADSAEDKRHTAVWMTSWDGTHTLRLTTAKQGETAPRWSPDGRWLAFLSSREDEHTQLWLLDRSGGEGRKLSSLAADVDDYVWAPDSKRVALVVEDADTAKPKTPPPIVIDRFQFKQDEAGYLGKQRHHLYVLDVATGNATILTPGDYDEFLPAWSPDSRSLAFVSKRRPQADRNNNWDLYVVDAAPGSAPRQLTTFAGADNDPETGSRPAWSPDGRWIAYLQGGPPRLTYHFLSTGGRPHGRARSRRGGGWGDRAPRRRPARRHRLCDGPGRADRRGGRYAASARGGIRAGPGRLAPAVAAER